MEKITIQTSRQIVPQIYAYTTPQISDHDGWVKIGYTDKEDVEDRIGEQCHTADIQWHTEWHGNAVYEGSREIFHDTDFHAYLQKLGIERNDHTEWFRISPLDSKNKFYSFRESRGKITGGGTVDYALRDSQQAAVEQTVGVFRKGPQECLWNAKPRFGKTLAVYALCMKMDLQKVLVVTNRPAIANSWYDDYAKFVGTERYWFVSEVSALKGKPLCLSREKYTETLKDPQKHKRLIEFVSLQDLKGSVHLGGRIEKLQEVAEIDWDLLVIDEAHEGVDTYKTDVAFDQIRRRHTLHLSGTPFKALANDKFSPEAIFNWTYADECSAREDWKPDRGTNPYGEMPKLNMFTYRMSDIVRDILEKGIEIDGEKRSFAFDLNEFFSVANGRFVHDGAVDRFLDALTRQEKYPFSTEKLRGELKHTFWILDRVESAKKLAEKLKKHPVFGNYAIIVAAGDGKTEDDSERALEGSYKRVKEAIKNNDKTLTLSVGQLTTGITVPEWTGVLMLSNMKSPALYMQAAFRAQNPCTFVDENNQYRQKENAYVFDFDPARTLTIYEEFANDLNPSTAAGKGGSDERREHIRKLLNFFPVIGEDEEGKMEELDAERVMSIPRRIHSQEVVRSGFMNNFLFQNISNIFGAPAVVTDILNKLESVDQPKIQMNNEETAGINVDENGDVVPSEEQVDDMENELFGVKKNLFGEKIYGEDTPEFNCQVSEAIEDLKTNTATETGQLQRQLDNIKDSLADRLTDKAKEMAQDRGSQLSKRNEAATKCAVKKCAQEELGGLFSTAQIDLNKADKQCQDNCKGKPLLEQREIMAQTEEKKKVILNRLNEEAQLKSNTVVAKSGRIIATAVVTQGQEDQKKDSEDKMRDKLRGFSRSIPSFLMAYGDGDTTLENFDKKIPDNVFEEVTGITTTDFRLLRDGGDTKNPQTGKVEPFKGQLFDGVVFNDSVKEFMALRKKLANYFDPQNKEDIFDYIPPQKTNQIFTPKRIVAKMVDMLEKENPGCFDDPEKTFADLYMKSGLYITEIVKRLYNSNGMKKAFPDDKERLQHIFSHQVYGLAPTECIYKIATNYILGFDSEMTNSPEEHHFRQFDTVPLAKSKGLNEEKLNEIFR